MKFLDLFRDWKDVAEYSANTLIFSEGNPAEGMYLILSGEVALTLHGDSLGIEGKGGIIGEMAMIRSAVLNATATTLTKATLARLDRSQFNEMVEKNPDFALHVMNVLAKRLRAVDQYIAMQFEQPGQ